MELTQGLNDTVNEMLSQNIDGQRFLCRRRLHSQETCRLEDEVYRLVSQSGMSVSEAKGFFDYMKISVERFSSVSR